MKKYKICIIGLGYVGLPLAFEFSKKFKTIGFDINHQRIKELKKGIDRTNEVSKKNILSAIKDNCSNNLIGFYPTSNKSEIKDSDIYIVTVPTPINKNKHPDLNPLIKASKLVGNCISKNNIVIYESTVFPGATEEICIPVIEKQSNLKLNKDFFAGYSPERINPGDKVNTLIKIKKVTSGSTSKVANEIDDLYNSILINGTYKAKSIKVAEASKVIENAQRDLNISFVNELALIFDKLNIDTNDVLDAASTKWNFAKFKPGLVGGHCIGVDPYYLAYKAESLGYYPEVIYSGRRVNESIPIFIADKVLKLMIKKAQVIIRSKILILGFTFKPDCPDVRNTRVVDVVRRLRNYGCSVEVYDPLINNNDINHYKEVNFTENIQNNYYDAVILAVPHKIFEKINYKNLKKSNKSIIYDVKGVLNQDIIDGRL